jgi:hypothetical protein
MREFSHLQRIQIAEKNYGNLRMIFKNNWKWKMKAGSLKEHHTTFINKAHSIKDLNQIVHS